jgi:ribonuclease H / adenosylcobalamin/alpha-ribazole phosphatase
MKSFSKTTNFLRYRFRHLFNYIIIGILSIILEVVVVKIFTIYKLPFIPAIITGFLSGMILSFILNAKLNFNVPKAKNKRTFIIFLAISTATFFLNLILIKLLLKFIPLDYSFFRIITSGLVFMISYTAHRKITFNFIKTVGIAVNLNDAKSIPQIYSKIKNYPDFIHIDFIDKTFDNNAKKVQVSTIKEICQTWRLKKMLHIMSKNPSEIINQLNSYVDVILFHYNIEEPLEKIIELCKNYHKKVGIVLSIEDSVNDIIKYLSYINFVQIMGINHLGKSGECLDISVLEKVKKLNKLKEKNSFEIIFDGGVKSTNIGRIDTKYIVSSSGILTAPNPIEAFMELKTSSRYIEMDYKIKKDLREDIKNILDSMNFIESGSIVGSFSEGKDLSGVKDIDIVIIVDNLTKNKFNLILNKFELLKQRIESDYGYTTKVNSFLGPLKFNEDIVFHVMVYDINSHKIHCERSPFTCFDWQKSESLIKKSISEVSPIQFLQPSFFFNSRRSAEEYLGEIRLNKLSYREYKFKGNKVIEEKKYKEMDSRERIEFAYHILKFLMNNFLKLYYQENKNYGSELTKKYFKIFPKNELKHKKLIRRIFHLKNSNKIKEYPFLIRYLELFINDFESQFKDFFYNKEIIFLRHAETKFNKEIFLGQKLNPEIVIPDKNIIDNLKKYLRNTDLFFSSPSKRCKQTVKLFSKQVIEEDRLNEIDYGDAEGKDIKYLEENYPIIIKGWKKGEDPKFPNGENSSDVEKRIINFFSEIRKNNLKKIVICTHNVVLRVILGVIFKIPNKDWFKININHLDAIKFLIPKNNSFYADLTDIQIKEIFKNL